MHTTPSLHLTEITNLTDWESLRPEWSQLWDQCPAATPFQLPEWLLPWWENLGGGDLWIITLRYQNQLAGLAPLFIWGLPGEKRTVSFLGAGITDHLDFLLQPDLAQIGTEMILRHISCCQVRWHICDFQELPTISPLLVGYSIPGVRLAHQPLSVCPILKLPSTIPAFWEDRPARYSRNIRRVRNLLEQMGPVEIEDADITSTAEFMAELFRLHTARWQAQDLSGMLADPQIRAFHTEVAAGMQRRGNLRLHRMRQHNRTIAVLYGFVDDQRAYYYLGGYDPEFDRFSLGTLIMAHAIETSIGAGLAELDFLRGQEAYKYAWGAVDRQNYQLLMQKTGSERHAG